MNSVILTSMRVALLSVVCAASVPPLLAHTEVEVQIQDLNRRVEMAPRAPDAGDMYFQRAEMERSLGQWSAAGADYERAGRLSPGLTALELAYGTMWLEAGRPKSAMPRLTRFTRAHPDNPHGHLMKARALARLERWRDAVAEYDQAIGLFPTAQPEFYLERTTAQKALGPEAYLAAIRDLDTGMGRLGEAITLQIAALELELGLKRFDQALARLGRIAARSPRPELWLARRADILEQARRTADQRVVSRGTSGAREEHGRYGAALAGPDNERRAAFQMKGLRETAVRNDLVQLRVGLAGGEEDPTAPIEGPSRYTTAREVEIERTVASQAASSRQADEGEEEATGPDPELLQTDPDPIAPLATVTRGPYLQSGSPTSVIVRWRTDVSTDSRVRYGASPGQLTQSATDLASTLEHIVTLTGMSPQTTHYYSVGTTAGPLAGGDLNHVFLTAPPPGRASPYRFWVIGDSGTANADAIAVRDRYATFTGSTPTNLWLMLGDNAYTIGTDAEFQSAVFNTYPDMLRKSVLWPTYGNHDSYSANASTQSGPYFDIFSLPTAGQAGGVASGTKAYYSFDYGNVHFICLESMDSAFRSPSGAQMMWLQQDLAATNKNWVIAFWHHPPYSRGSHNSDNTNGSDPELVQMRQNFLPVLEQAGVDLVLSGHSHSYERSYLIDGHYGLSGTFTNAMKKDGGDGRPAGNGAYEKATLGKAPHEGAVYAVAGSSGQIGGGTLNHPAMYISLNRLGSLVLDVNGGRLDAKFLDNTGAVLDTFTVMKGASSPRPVPDGDLEPGVPATAQKLALDGSAVRLTWDTLACQTSTQYEVIWGRGATLPAYTPSGAACNIGNGGSYDWMNVPAVPGGERFIWWTIVGTDGLSQEGSWGYDSSGAERHAGSSSGLCGITAKDTTNSCP